MGVRTATSQARERSFTGATSQNKHDRGLIIKTKPREVMLSMSPPRPRVDEKLPSSAPETSQRCRGSFVASWPIVAQARGSGDAAGAAHAHRAAAAHPAHRRGEERPRARRHDGVEAPLRHCARHAGAAPPAGGVAKPERCHRPTGCSLAARTRGTGTPPIGGAEEASRPVARQVYACFEAHW